MEKYYKGMEVSQEVTSILSGWNIGESEERQAWKAIKKKKKKRCGIYLQWNITQL